MTAVRPYGFERDIDARWEFMPLELRRRLDVVGLRLSLAPWQSASVESRAALCARGFETEDERIEFGAAVRALAMSCGAVVAEVTPAASPPPWEEDAAFDAVRERAAFLGVAVSREWYLALGDERRYAVYRLSDGVKRGEKFLAALREFGVGSS